MAHNRAERTRELWRRRRRKKKLKKLKARLAETRSESERARIIEKIRRISPFSPIPDQHT